MEIIQFDFSGKGQPEIAETVYDSLLGLLVPGCRLPWVENIFVPGHPCYQEYDDMHIAYARLRDRLGGVQEDRDAEEMISCLLEYSKIVALEMFKYGQKYQQLLDGEASYK